MSVIKKRIFYHHADASALGGYFDSPVVGTIPIQGSLSLSPSGGFSRASVGKYSFHELVSFESAHTLVSGSYSKETRSWTTVATTTVEGFKLQDVLTADRLVAHLISETPDEPGLYEPTVSAFGSTIEGLKISGCEVKVEMDYDLFRNQPDATPDGAEPQIWPSTSLFKNQSFLDKVEAQYTDTVARHANIVKDGALRVSGRPFEMRDWVAKRYSVDDLRNKTEQRGVVLCSLVKAIKSDSFHTHYGNILDLPDFGRIFLGEILVDYNTHRVIMVRAELGSAGSGGASGGTASLEGRPWP